MKQRITDDLARHYKQVCPKDNGQQFTCSGCFYDEENHATCPSTWGSSLLASDLLDARAQLDIAVNALEDENYELNVLWQELKDLPGSRIKELGERVYERNRRVSEIIGTIERDALKEIQG